MHEETEKTIIKPQMPSGKTRAIVTHDVYQSDLKKGDSGYIDAYVWAVDNPVYAVFVRQRDGLVDMVKPLQLKAVL